MGLKKILVVDDEPLVASTLNNVLKACLPPDICEVVVFTSSEQAIQFIYDNQVAVVLSDLQMPVFDGTAVLKAAHERNPDTVSILITARITKEGMLKAINEGHVWRCVEKPWDSGELCNIVKDALDKYQENVDRSFSQTSALKSRKDNDRAPVVIRKDKAGKVAPAKAKGKKIISIAGKKRVAAKPKVAVNKYRINKAKGPQKKISIVKPNKSNVKIQDKRYKNLELIKEGGLCLVYKATDDLLGMPVAIKVLSSSCVKNASHMKTLLQEARVAMQLSHKHIVRLHNINESNNMFYLVMEYIDGKSLREILDEYGALSLDSVEQIVSVCASALGYAHRRKVYHRDLKPANIMMTSDGVLKVIDFGIACLAETARDTDVICGTPYYMSPEEIAGDPLDQRADIYSLGVIVHELLTGELPLPAGEEAPDPDTYVPVISPDLPLSVRQVLELCFARQPSDRWETIDDFSNAFAQAVAIGKDAAKH